MNRKQQIFNKCLAEMTPIHLRGLAKAIAEGISIIEASKKNTEPEGQMDLFGAENEPAAETPAAETEPVETVEPAETAEPVEAVAAAEPEDTVEPATEETDPAVEYNAAAKDEAYTLLTKLRDTIYAIRSGNKSRITKNATAARNLIDNLSDAARKEAESYKKEFILELNPNETDFSWETLRRLLKLNANNASDTFTVPHRTDLADYDTTGGMADAEYHDNIYNIYKIRDALEYFAQEVIHANPERMDAIYAKGLMKVLYELDNLPESAIAPLLPALRDATAKIYSKLFGVEHLSADELANPIDALKAAFESDRIKFNAPDATDMLYELGLNNENVMFDDADEETRRKIINGAVSKIMSMGGAEQKELFNDVRSLVTENRIDGRFKGSFDDKFLKAVTSAIRANAQGLDPQNLRNAAAIGISALAANIDKELELTSQSSSTLMDDVKASVDSIVSGNIGFSGEKDPDTNTKAYDIADLVNHIKSYDLTPAQATELEKYIDDKMAEISSYLKPEFVSRDPIYGNLKHLKSEIARYNDKLVDRRYRSINNAFNIDEFMNKITTTTDPAVMNRVVTDVTKKINDFATSRAGENINSIVADKELIALNSYIEGHKKRLERIDAERKNAEADLINKGVELRERIANGDPSAKKEKIELSKKASELTKTATTLTQRIDALSIVYSELVRTHRDQKDLVQKINDEELARQRRELKAAAAAQKAADDKLKAEEDQLNAEKQATWTKKFGDYRSESDSVVDYDDATYSNPNDVGYKARFNDNEFGTVTTNKVRKEFETAFNSVAAGLGELDEKKQLGINQLAGAWNSPDPKYKAMVKAVIAGEDINGQKVAIPGFNKAMLQKKFQIMPDSNGNEYLAYNVGNTWMPALLARELLRGEYETSTEMGESKSQAVSDKTFDNFDGARFYKGDDQVEGFGDSMKTFGGAMELAGGRGAFNDDDPQYVRDFVTSAEDEATKGNDPDIAKYIKFKHTDNLTHKYPKVWHIKEKTKNGESTWGASVEFNADSQTVTITNDKGGEPIVVPVKGMAGMIGSASLSNRMVSRIMQPLFNTIANSMSK